MEPERKLEKSIVHEGRHVNLVVRGSWEYVERRDISGIVILVARTDADEIVLVEQYRPPIDALVIELPAGLAGDIPGQEDEGLETAARRELLEETGYEATEVAFLFKGFGSAGITDEELHFFRATGLNKVGPGGGDDSEDIAVHVVPLNEVHAWLDECARQGKAIDAKIYAGLNYLGNKALP